MNDPPSNDSRRVPLIAFCVGVVALLISQISAAGFEQVARLALIHAPICLTMGTLGMIDPRLFYAPFPQREGIPRWARIVGCVAFVGAALFTLMLLVARYGQTGADI